MKKLILSSVCVLFFTSFVCADEIKLQQIEQKEKPKKEKYKTYQNIKASDVNPSVKGELGSANSPRLRYGFYGYRYRNNY